jgi:hypothetical protein
VLAREPTGLLNLGPDPAAIIRPHPVRAGTHDDPEAAIAPELLPRTKAVGRVRASSRSIPN